MQQPIQPLGNSAANYLGTTVLSERHVTTGTTLPTTGFTGTTGNLLNQGFNQGTQFNTTGSNTTGLASNIINGNYPTVTFRPLEAKFVQDKDLIGKMDPYCKFKIGWHSGKSSVAKSQGTHPVWGGEAITIKRKHNEEFVKIKVKDSDTLTLDDRLGDVKLRLDDIAAKGKMTQWFPLEKRGKMTGEILLDIEYHGSKFQTGTTPLVDTRATHTTGILPTTAGVLPNTTGTGYPTNTTNTAYPTTTGMTSHGKMGGKWPTVTFRPIEGKFYEDKDLIGKMDPYCKFKIGWSTGKSSVAKSQGVHPVWSGDAVTLKRKHGKEFAKIKIKDKDTLSLNDKIGEVKINLNDLAAKGRLSQWFPVEKRGKMTGEILCEIDYNGATAGTNQVPIA
jgi:Ca2+-dependent lipid-binding protein